MAEHQSRTDPFDDQELPGRDNTPYGDPAATAANPVVASPPVKSPRGTWRIVVGILLVVLGAPNLVRGISLTVLSIVRPAAIPEGPAYASGIAFSGAIFVAWGLFLAVRGSRINTAKRRAALQRQA